MKTSSSFDDMMWIRSFFLPSKASEVSIKSDAYFSAVAWSWSAKSSPALDSVFWIQSWMNFMFESEFSQHVQSLVINSTKEADSIWSFISSTNLFWLEKGMKLCSKSKMLAQLQVTFWYHDTKSSRGSSANCGSNSKNLSNDSMQVVIFAMAGDKYSSDTLTDMECRIGFQFPNRA